MANEQEVNDEQIEAEAREMGWSDKDNWRGKPEDWMDAKTFVERGRQILPIVQARNESLTREVNANRTRLAQVEGALRAANTAIEALQEAHEEDTKEQVEAARAELRQQLAAASRDGDHDQVAELTDKMTQLNTAAADADDKKGDRRDNRQPPQRTEMPPEIQQWYRQNPDFMNSRRHIALANIVADELRQEGEASTGTMFLDKVAERVEKELGKAGRGVTRVGAGNGGSGRNEDRSNLRKGYSDLPADAKEACDRMAKRLVGENRKHKDINSWRAAYATKYFEEQGA